MSTESTPTVEELQNKLQKNELKVKALLEDITNTREQNADLRVEVTYLSQFAQQLQEQLRASEHQNPATDSE